MNKYENTQIYLDKKNIVCLQLVKYIYFLQEGKNYTSIIIFHACVRTSVESSLIFRRWLYRSTDWPNWTELKTTCLCCRCYSYCVFENCHGRKRKCSMDNMKKWTSLPMPELPSVAPCRKWLEEDPCWIVLRFPSTTQSDKGLNWTELHYTELNWQLRRVSGWQLPEQRSPLSDK